MRGEIDSIPRSSGCQCWLHTRATIFAIMRLRGIAMSEQDEQRLKELDSELEKIQELFKEYHSWYDAKTAKVWFPPGRYFNYDNMVDREQELLKERKVIKKRLESA